MPTVFVMCDACQREIDTRIEMDRATFDQLPPFESQMSCPKCGALSFWHKSKARLGDESGQSKTA